MLFVNCHLKTKSKYRKNHLNHLQIKKHSKFRSYNGVRYTAILFSITGIAIINCLNVKAYLGWVLSNIYTLSIDDLLPYSEKANKFKLILMVEFHRHPPPGRVTP